MAAQLSPAPSRPPEIADLRRLSARSLEPLLREETAAWWDSLEWDFEKSADLVRRFLDLRALNGYALIGESGVFGFVYYVMEENKGLLGDLYVMRAQRTLENENLLLGNALQSILVQPHITRVESQLMMLEFSSRRQVPAPGFLQSFERNFMRLDLRRAALPEARIRRPMLIDHWNEHHQEAAAHLVAEAYNGHVDSRINDQYRTAAGARRFLHNIVQYPGCGAFFRPASFAAIDPVRGVLSGVSLTSLVSRDCGHITQICVAPDTQGSGIGHALLRQSLLTLRDLGCTSASLTVTASNTGAVALYERLGFRTIRHFSAYVWEGFKG